MYDNDILLNCGSYNDGNNGGNNAWLCWCFVGGYDLDVKKCVGNDLESEMRQTERLVCVKHCRGWHKDDG